MKPIMLLFAASLSTLVLAHSAPAAALEIRGTIRVAPELAKKLKPTAALYIVARKPDAGPMPLLVLRVAQPLKFPLEFKLTEANSMMPGTPLDGKLAISARINQAGPAGPTKPGDLEPSAPPPVVDVAKPKKVTITIDQEKK